MNITDKEIREAERKLQALRDKQHAQKYEIPPLETKAKMFVGLGYSDAYIQGILYASATANIGITDIVNAIEKAKSELCNTVVN